MSAAKPVGMTARDWAARLAMREQQRRADAHDALLAALERAQSFIRSDYTLPDGTDISNGLIAQIDAAIKSAKGQS